MAEDALNSTSGRPGEGSITIVYTNNDQFDQQSKREIRAHAGRWSRANRPIKVTKKQTLPFIVSFQTPKTFAELNVLRKSKKEGLEAAKKSSNAKAARFRPATTLSGGYSFGCKLDAFQTLPQLPLERARPDALSVAKSHMSTVLGADFVRRNMPLNAGQSTVMYVSSLLLTYARHYALTGKCLSPDLLELKGEVIKIVNSSHGTGIDLESLFAVFVLSTPVVCLTTTQRPSSSTAREFLFVDKEVANPAAVEETLANEIALRDHLLHRQTVMRILLEMGPVKLRQARIGCYFLAYFIL